MHARLGAGGQPDQHVADMADGAIGHQPLDVGLVDRGEGGQQHGRDGNEDNDLLPLAGQVSERPHEHTYDQRHGGDFGRIGEERGNRRGRPLVDVRGPHVKRHRRDLEGEAGDDECDADDHAERDRFFARGRLGENRA